MTVLRANVIQATRDWERRKRPLPVFRAFSEPKGAECCKEEEQSASHTFHCTAFDGQPETCRKFVPSIRGQYHLSLAEEHASNLRLQGLSCRCVALMGGMQKRVMIDNTYGVVLRGSGREMIPVLGMEAFAGRFGFRFAAHSIGEANGQGRVGRPFSFIEKLSDWTSVRQLDRSEHVGPRVVGQGLRHV